MKNIRNIFWIKKETKGNNDRILRDIKNVLKNVINQ